MLQSAASGRSFTPASLSRIAVKYRTIASDLLRDDYFFRPSLGELFSPRCFQLAMARRRCRMWRRYQAAVDGFVVEGEGLLSVSDSWAMKRPRKYKLTWMPIKMCNIK
ncbi:unnamed protein product [Rhodiola kirilowii]